MGSSVSLWTKHKPDHNEQSILLINGSDNPKGGNLTGKNVPQFVMNFAQCVSKLMCLLLAQDGPLKNMALVGRRGTFVPKQRLICIYP